ncbi:hypothetical protein [Spiroplasma endosymbiont of Crioceris asparagi]|uniref:hypothetical protein n=1 Tax=Spiroplasma endosymbiont of Crioceris asparagi TaxID=3066286 RepID=UPI0030CD1273
MDNIKKINLQEKVNEFKFKNDKNVICIGNFDGLHLIHRKILNAGNVVAKINNMSFSIFTFSEKIAPTQMKYNLQAKQTKYEIMNQLYSPDYIFEMQVNEATKSTSYEDFMKYLKDVLHVQKIVIGSDFRFGFEGRGKVTFLKEYFGEENIIIYTRTQFHSTTNIKKLLQEHKYYEIYELNKRFHEVLVLNNTNKKYYFEDDEFPFEDGKYEVVIENELYVMEVNGKKITFDNEIKSKQKYLLIKMVSFLEKKKKNRVDSIFLFINIILIKIL